VEAKTEWRCFHCSEVFTDRPCAERHFGRDEGKTPACIIKGADGGLLRALRDAENQADEAIALMHSESTDVAKAYGRASARHTQALMAAEEAGYEKGLADGRALPSNPDAPDRVTEGEGERIAIRDYLFACSAEANRQSLKFASAGNRLIARDCKTECKAYSTAAAMIEREDHASYRPLATTPARLLEENEALRAALEPFVRHGRAIGAFSGDNGPYWIMTDEGHRDVPAADFHAARAALGGGAK